MAYGTTGILYDDTQLIADLLSAMVAQADFNSYTDAEKAKLAGIEPGAQVNRTPTQITADYHSIVPKMTTTEVDAGTSADIRTVDATLLKRAAEQHGGVGSAGHTIKAAGTPLTARAGLNFGTGLTASDDAANDESDVIVAFGSTSTTAAAGNHNHDTVYVPLTRTLTGADSIAAIGDLSANRTLRLVNDTASPGANKSYGTDGSGVRVWRDFPTSGTAGSVNANRNNGTISVALTATEAQLGSTTITPSSTGSKILVAAVGTLLKDSTTTQRYATLRIRRGTTNTDPLVTEAIFSPGDAASARISGSFIFYDEPGTTAATSYSVRGSSAAGGVTADTFYLIAVEIGGAAISPYSPIAVNITGNTTLTKATHQHVLLDVSAAAATLTVDANTLFDTWAFCEIFARGGIVTITASGVTINRPSGDPLTIPQYGWGILRRDSAGNYSLTGRLQ